MTSYRPGQVSATLFKSKKKSTSKNSDLTSLFASTKLPPTTAASSSISVQKQISPEVTGQPKVGFKENEPPSALSKVKEKRKDGNKRKKFAEQSDSDRTITTDLSQNEYGYIHESLRDSEISPAAGTQKQVAKRKRTKSKDLDEDEDNVKRPRRDRKRDKRADARTIFVGNCPLSADKKTLTKLFKEHGDIETVRFRCAPPAEPNLPRRAIVITKNFHERSSSYIAYVVFKDEAAAKNSLVKNGFLLDGLHLRVDLASSGKKHDKKRSVFIGNLPFTVSEEEIRSHFTDCGDITNVRIVRDRQTSLGKGICYVQFQSKDSVSLALKLNKSDFEGRQLRVMPCVNKPEKKKSKETTNKTQALDKRKPKISFAPSNTSTTSFKSVLKMKKEKRLRKMKKKKDNAKKSDGLSAIFGESALATKKQKAKKAKGNKKEPWSSKSVRPKKKMSLKSKGNKLQGKSKRKGK